MNEELIRVYLNLEAVKDLFAGPNVPDVNHLAAFAYRKACMNNVEVAHYLLTSHKINLSNQKIAFIATCRRGGLKAYRMIVDNSNILEELSIDEIDECFYFASENGLVPSLMSDFGVPDMPIEDAINYISVRREKRAIDGIVGSAPIGQVIKI